MNNLVGKKFVIDQTRYVIVDVRNVDGIVMVYAERTDGVKGPGRAAFRYADLHMQLDESEVA